MATDNSPPSPTLDFPAEETKTNQESQKQEAAKENETHKDEFYKTKEINFQGRKKRIILQHKNGPCPLIAICNVLLLRDVINLYTDSFEVSEAELVVLVATALIDDDDSIRDTMDRVQSFANGIDVDIKFTSIDGFEFTPELAAFDLLKIPLYHGWIVDPEDVKTTTAIGSKSYNALTTEPFVLKSPSGQSSGKCSGKKDTNELTPEEGELIRKFLKDNASQLTWSGLFELKQGVEEGVLCVLFRNNHFCTLLKHENELYTLVTDEGYQKQEDLVWEKLNKVNGDSVFFTGNFEVFKNVVWKNWPEMVDGSKNGVEWEALWNTILDDDEKPKSKRARKNRRNKMNKKARKNKQNLDNSESQVNQDDEVADEKAQQPISDIPLERTEYDQTPTSQKRNPTSQKRNERRKRRRQNQQEEKAKEEEVKRKQRENEMQKLLEKKNLQRQTEEEYEKTKEKNEKKHLQESIKILLEEILQRQVKETDENLKEKMQQQERLQILVEEIRVSQKNVERIVTDALVNRQDSLSRSLTGLKLAFLQQLATYINTDTASKIACINRLIEELDIDQNRSRPVLLLVHRKLDRLEFAPGAPYHDIVSLRSVLDARLRGM